LPGSALVLPLLALLAHKLVAPLLGLAALLTLLRDPGLLRRGWRTWPWLLLGLLAFIGYGLLLTPLALEPGRSLQLMVNIALLALTLAVLFGLQADPVSRRRMGRLLVIGMWLAIGLFFTDHLLGYPLLNAYQEAHGHHLNASFYNRGNTALAMLLFPALLYLLGRQRLGHAILLALAVFTANWSSESSAAWTAALLGLSIALLVYLGGRRVVYALTALTLLIMLVLPFPLQRYSASLTSAQVLTQLPVSWQHRLQIWTYTAARIEDKPLLGWGPDSARTIGRRLGQVEIRLYWPSGKLSRFQGDPIPLHPHCGTLQLWLEFGGLGVVFLLALIGAVGWRIGRLRARLPQALASGLLVTVLAISNTAYGLWQFAWLGIILLAALYTWQLIGEQR